jgi:hypothetical protein
MRCYFLRDGRVVGVAMMPPGISEREAIARAHTLSLKRRSPIDALEVWDGAHFIMRNVIRSADGPLGNSPGREPDEVSA